jgi:cytochrome c-type biogenesis protein CcmH
MLQYLITGLAGIALGIVGMRLWQAKDASAPAPASDVETEGGVGASAAPTAAVSAGASRKPLLIGAGALAAIAVAVFTLRPSGDDGAMALTSGGAAPAQVGPDGKSLADVDTSISNLAARLEKNPTDGEGFRFLGWSYVATGKADKAIEPYKRAIALLPKNASAHAGYGEAMTAVAGAKVTPEAKAEFDKALTIDPAEPRARYFNGLWLAQNGKEREALDKWVVLANSAPADTAWQAEVRGKIAEVSKKLGVDVSAKLKGGLSVATAGTGVSGPDAATIKAAQQLPADQKTAMVDNMVEGLAAKLKANPKNVDGWVMLLRSRMVMKQGTKAADDLAIARRALAGDATGLSRVNAAAAEVGVPGAK